MENIVIGIEGTVGAGKTSICRKLLDKIENSIILHGGNIYRAIVYGMSKSRKINKNRHRISLCRFFIIALTNPLPVLFF